jgi:hypothetical protein
MSTWDVGPYVGGMYRVITPTDRPFEARIVAHVPRLEDARRIARAPELEAENARLRADLRGIARYVMTHQDAIRDGSGMMELARMLDAALDSEQQP